MTIIEQLYTALQAGEELVDSANWKNRQATTSAIAALIGAGAVVLPSLGVHVDVKPETILALGGLGSTALWLCNCYLTAATSKRMGVQPIVKSVSPATPDGGLPAGSGLSIDKLQGEVKMDLMGFAEKMKAIMAIFHAMEPAVAMAETMIPGQGQGAAKLKMVMDMAGAVEGGVEEMAPVIQNVVGVIVAAKKAAG